jgi:hypothetical protein
VPQPGHDAHAPSPEPPPGTEKSSAMLWPPMPRARARLREPGAPHGTDASGAGRAYHRTGAASPATPCPSDGAQRHHARAFRRGVHHGEAPPCAHPPAIHTTHPRDKAPPL